MKIRTGLTLGIGLLCAAVTLLALVSANPAEASRSRRPGDKVEGQYIIVLKDGVSVEQKADRVSRGGGRVRHVYRFATRGFAANLNQQQLDALRADPDVVAVVQDVVVTMYEDLEPSGVRRSEAWRNPVAQIGTDTNPIDADVAIIDTGIDVDHPDLNVVGGVGCVPGEATYDDFQGHGTHVAGTVGALDNGIGVVGVAPGARLWAVRVLDANGEGAFSDVICGVDWVTANAGVIEVANMSLGGPDVEGSCTDNSLHEAICESVAAGVTVVVAAGNSADNAAHYVPAAYDEVITVSALTDTDGLPGGTGPFSFYGRDDSLASYSNFGADVDIAAPGTDIYSTLRGGGYGSMSGTSMASPHVAGAAAIYRMLNPAASQEQVKAGLLALAHDQSGPYGFTGDVDAYPEKVLNAGAVGGTPLPVPTPVCTLSPEQGNGQTYTTVACGQFRPSELVRIYWETTATAQKGQFRADAYGNGSLKFIVPITTGGPHPVIALGSAYAAQSAVNYTVLASLMPNVTSAAPGGSVVLTLRGFGPGETATISWVAPTGTTQLKSVVTSSSGGGSVLLTVPEAAKGSQYSFLATGATSGLSASAPFSVTSGASLMPSVGAVGSSATATFRGYAAGEVITVRWYDAPGAATTLGTTTASSQGTATFAFVVPEGVKDAHAVEGTGNQGSTATATYRIGPKMTASVSAGPVGSTSTLTLTGFGANEQLTVLWYHTTTSSATLATVNASPKGSASYLMTVPTTTGGMHKVEIVGSTGTKLSLYFTVQAKLTLSPVSGASGTTVTVTLSGYNANASVDIRWYASQFAYTRLTAVTMSSSGSATATIVVPAGQTLGGHKVEGYAPSGGTRASATFTVQ